MTPILLGRWQTRIFLASTAGVVITIIFGLAYDRLQELSVLLLDVTLLGLVLDIFYTQLQLFRWDNDWPPAFHVLTGILEGALIWFLVKNPIFWDRLPGMAHLLTFRQFLAHYSTVFIVTFFINWNLMKVIFPHWRYRGGRII